jgi:non-heme chloroperoxidase
VRSSRGRLAVGLGAVALGVAVVRRADARWGAAEDPCGPHEALLPPGRAASVTTDDGAELAVTVIGDEGPTIVLSHGWTCTREAWAPVTHRLVRTGHRVVLYDHRGHGSSTIGSEGITVDRLGADLAALLEALDIRDAVIGGHSMGAMTMQALAADHLHVLDARARALVMVATAASGLSRGPRQSALAGRLVASPVVERLMRSGVGHAFVRGSVGASPRRNHMVLTRDGFTSCVADVRLACFSSMQVMDLREGIGRIGMPVTVMVGTHDRLTPPHRAAELVDTIPEATLVTLEGMGHQLHLEAPDEVAEALAEAARRVEVPA